MTPRVGVVHAPNAAVGIQDLVRAARGRCQLVLLLRPEVAAANPQLVGLTQALAETHVLDDDDLLRLRLDGLTTFHDAQLEYTDGQLHRLDLPGAVPVPHPWDKLTQRRLFGSAGISQVAAVGVDSAARLTGAVAEVGLPAVLKPRRSAGSVGLSFLHRQKDVTRELGSRRDWSGLVLEAMIPRGRHPGNVPWLADYVSVETLTGPEGRHRHVAVFDKLPLSISDEPSPVAVRETGDVLPTRLPPDRLAQALATVDAVLDALGVRSRVSHTELRVSESGVDVIEVNGRLGGEVDQMLRLLGGPAMVQAALDLASGAEAIEARPLTRGYVVCVYVPFARRDGLVRSDTEPSRLRAIEGVVRVDELARHGQPRSATAYHAAKLTLRTATAAAMDEALVEVLDVVTELFTMDGVADDPWLPHMRAATLTRTGA